jgi:two-component system chemotaxis response regulator CheB
MAEPTPSDPIRVLLIDDSAVIRGFVNRALQDLPEVMVVGSVADGQAGVNFAGRELADVIILDIEMPIMDGLTAIPLLMKAQPWASIIMSSTLTLQGAEVSVRAMSLGAADYVSKPTSTREADATAEWKRDLLEKVKALGRSAWQQRQSLGKVSPSVAGAALRSAAMPVTPVATPVSNKSRLYEGGSVTLRPVPTGVPDILAIGSSTGGPQALFTVLPHLKNLRQPIVITQHMPKTFTTILADHITKQTGLPCDEAKEGAVLVPGRALLAAGDYHLLFTREGGHVKAHLTQDAQENFCRPAVDPMLRSLIEMYGASKILVTILTGMGADGLKGSSLVVAGGGMVVGQDQLSSVVWGMPGAVATAGLCSALLPVTEIGQYLRKKAGGS